MATGDIYRALHARSLKDPEGFWAEQAEAIDWSKRWDTVLDSSNPPFYRWFKGGALNACQNALDRHVEGGRAEQVALIYDSPVTGTKKSELLIFLTPHVVNSPSDLAAVTSTEHGKLDLATKSIKPEDMMAFVPSTAK